MEILAYFTTSKTKQYYEYDWEAPYKRDSKEINECIETMMIEVIVIFGSISINQSK